VGGGLEGAEVRLDGVPVTAAEASRLSPGTGTSVLLYERTPGAGEEQVSVSFELGARWELAGVIGLRAAGAGVAASLLAFPQQRLVEDLPLAPVHAPRLHFLAAPLNAVPTIVMEPA